MWLIWIGLALLVLHFAGIGPFADIRWYWCALPLGLAVVWFEVIERTFGLDRRKSFDEMDQAKRKRVQKALGEHAQSARRRRGRR